MKSQFRNFYYVLMLVAITQPIFASSTPSTTEQNVHTVVIEDFIPPVDGIHSSDWLEDYALPDLPDAFKNIANEKAKEASEVPESIRKIRARNVNDYFRDAQNKEAIAQAKMVLLRDALTLHQYYESDNSTYKNFVDIDLPKFINSLEAEKLRTPIRGDKLTRPIGSWSVETLVITEQLAFMTKSKHFVRDSLDLITGKHLKGATALAGVIVLSAIGTYVADHYGFSPYAAGVATGAFVGSSILGAFQAGPLAALLNAASGWFIQPTTEYIKRKSLVVTGPWEQKINHFFDEKGQNGSAETNEHPHPASLETIGTSFAGMSEDEQKRNWKKDLRIWVSIAKTYGQVLRDTHHVGRFWNMVSWTDEQSAKLLVEAMDSKLAIYDVDTKAILIPHVTALLSDFSLPKVQRRANAAALQEHARLFQTLNEKFWLEMNLTSSEMSEIEAQIMFHFDFLSEVLTPTDMKDLLRIQKERKKAIRSLFTALTLNEIRAFNGPETNRNLDEEAKVSYKAMREGLQLQEYVDKYRTHVQLTMQQMGYENAIKPKCHDLFK